MDLVPVFEQNEIPRDIIEKIKKIYVEDDVKYILNDSYYMFQHIYDIETPHCEACEWFKKRTDGSCDYVIIHWDW